MIYKKELKPKDRRRQNKLKKILSKAMEMVDKGGLDSFTINGLAAELDYTPGALYRYYSAKDSIIAELQILVISRLKEMINQEVSKIKTSENQFQLKSLIIAAETYKAFSQNNFPQFRLLANLLGNPIVMINLTDALRVMSPVNQLLSDISGLFQKSQDAGLLTPGNASERSVLFFCGTHSLLQMNKLNRISPELFQMEHLYREMIFSLLCGWGADKEKLEKIYQDLELSELKNIYIDFFN